MAKNRARGFHFWPHGAALRVALVVFSFVHYGEDAFVVLGGHAYERAHPHPEYRSGATHHEGYGHTGDIAESYGGGYYRCQCLNG